MSIAQYTGRKSLQAIAASADGHGNGLKQTLGPLSLVGLGIGCIIGAGIFVLTGKAAASYAGPAISLSFILSGIACAFVGLCYAELAAMIPASGSAYTYAYATVGEIFAWIIGWDLILEYGMGAATVAVGWSGYFVSLLGSFGIHVPPQWAQATGEAVKLADGTSSHRHLQSAGRADRPGADRPADGGHAGIDAGQQHHGRVQAVRCRRSHCCRRILCRNGRIGRPSSRRTPARSAISAGAACCAAPPWCSSPISGSTPFRPPLRRPGTRNGICPSASSAR